MDSLEISSPSLNLRASLLNAPPRRSIIRPSLRNRPVKNPQVAWV
jgi:hypothetical protein